MTTVAATLTVWVGKTPDRKHVTAMSQLKTAGAAPGTSLSPARTRLCVVLLVLLGFALGCAEFVVIGIEPEISRELNVPLARVGELISFFAVTYALATPLLALTTGRFRRFPLLVAYSVVFLLGNAAAAFSPTFEVLLASRVVVGAVSGALLALGVTYIPELLGQRRVSMAISVIYGAFSVAMVVSTSAGKLIADALDWRAPVVVTLALCAVVVAALLAVLPRTGATDEPATMGEQFVLLRQPCVLTGMAIFIFGVGSTYVFYGYVTPYLEDVLGMTSLGASGVLMGYGAVCLVSNLLSGWVDARFGMKGLLVVFPLQALILLALYLVTPAMPLSVVIIMLVALDMYVVSLPCISLFMRTANEKCPKALTLASSLEPMSFNVGIAFGTAVGGVVVSGPGMEYAGLVGAALSCVAFALVVLTLFLARRSR